MSTHLRSTFRKQEHWDQVLLSRLYIEYIENFLGVDGMGMGEGYF